MGPLSATPGTVSEERAEREVQLAVDAGLDLIRLNGHIAHPALYAAADRAGVLIWQDLPLQWGYHRSVRRQAVRQARQAVDLLGHHPSIALWCGHNEPGGPVPTPTGRDGERTAAAPSDRVASQGFGRYLLGQELPGWNRSVLDRSIRRALAGADPTRPVIAHSGVLPHPPSLDGTDFHSPLGWRWGHVDDLPGLARLFPRLVRFVGELGSQAVPDTADFCEPDRWPRLDWPRLERDFGLERAVLTDWVDEQEPPDFDSWRAATQRHQAEVIRRHVEGLRLLKYHPTGGFAVSFLSDARPAISAALVDHEGSPKAAYAALREACRPVIVVAGLPAAPLGAGHLHADVHVVSDLRHAVEGAVVTAVVQVGGSRRVTRWEGDVPADACTRIGEIHVDVPEGPGEISVELTLRAAGVDAANRYTTICQGTTTRG